MQDALRAGGIGLGKERAAQRGQRAGKRDEAEDAHDDDHHQRAQVAAAEADQRAEAAIAGQRHAIAEDQPADDGAERIPLQIVVEAGAEVDQPRHRADLRAQDGHGQHDPPKPEAALILGIDGAFQRAEGAEIPQAGGQPHDQSADQPDEGSQHSDGQRLHRPSSLS